MSDPRPAARRVNPLALLERFVLAPIGRQYIALATVLGGVIVLFFRILRALVPPRFDRDETWRALYDVGIKSFPVVIMTALFVGAIMVIQTGFYVKRTGATGLLGFGVGFAIFAEIGPILIGLMFSGRVGANNTAELGTMVVTEQIDALRSLAIDPIRHLVVPRFFAMMIMMTLLMVLGDLFAVIGAGLTAEVMLDVNMETMITTMLDSHLLDEFTMGVVKASCFGVTISCLSCYFGLSATGGATGVGRAVNNSVVANATAILIVDFVVGTLYTLGGSS